MLVAMGQSAGAVPTLHQEFALCFRGKLAAKLEAIRIQPHFLGEIRASRPWTIWKARRQLLDLIQVLKTDWVVFHSAWTLALLGPALHGVKLKSAIWLHDVASGRHWVERLARLARPDFAICNSYYTAQSLDLLFRDLRFDVIHCPVPPPDTLPPTTRASVRTQLGSGSDTFVILIAARFEEWKGHQTLLKALDLLRSDSRWTCWIVGGAQRKHEQEYRFRLEITARSSGLSDRVKFLGHRDDVASLMASADLYCQPNTSPEPFGISIVEALYAGLPVIVSNTGGPREIMTPECGSLVEPKDSENLAHEIKKVFDSTDVRKIARTYGPARARELCDPEQQLMRFSHVLGLVKAEELSSSSNSCS